MKIYKTICIGDKGRVNIPDDVMKKLDFSAISNRALRFTYKDGALYAEPCEGRRRTIKPKSRKADYAALLAKVEELTAELRRLAS